MDGSRPFPAEAKGKGDRGVARLVVSEVVQLGRLHLAHGVRFSSAIALQRTRSEVLARRLDLPSTLLKMSLES